MSIPTLATRKRLVAAKLETTQGTAIALAAADGTVPCYDPKLKYNIPWNKRPSPGSSSNSAGVPGPRAGELTFQTHLYNSGSVTLPTLATTLLAACGLVNTSGTLAPVTGSSSANTITGGLYQAGRLKTIVGAAGTFTIKGTVGNPLLMDFRFLGKHAAPSAVSIITPTYDTVIPPRFAGATLSLGGTTTYRVKEFTFDAGNNLVLVESGGESGDATGYAWCVVDGDREPTLGLKLMAIAAKDFYADHIAGTEAAFSCAVGSGSNNVVTLAAPKAQLMESPDDEDNNGYMLDVLKFQLNKSAAAGDDEYTIAFS